MRDLLRQTVATLAYRAGKALRGAPTTFSDFSVGPSSRTPGQILAHMCDLLDWGLTMANGNEKWNVSSPAPWERDSARFHAGLDAFDKRLASADELGVSEYQLFQGPIADALTHTGQLTMLRRLAGAPVRGENYARADIVLGRLGSTQTAPRREFD
jgi:hypothetical protein